MHAEDMDNIETMCRWLVTWYIHFSHISSLRPPSMAGYGASKQYTSTFE